MGRRGVLRGALAGAAAAGIAAVAAPQRLLGANDNPVLLGHTNFATLPTSIDRSDVDTGATFGLPSTGVFGFATVTDGVAVSGDADATNGVGVAASTTGDLSQIALRATTGGANGVGIAVKAVVKNGTAVWAECTGGNAIDARGPTVFSRSGRVSFAAGQKARTLSGYRIAAATLVLATIQGDVGGMWVRGVSVSVANQNFTIRLNKAAPVALSVGWFIVN
jgi:hypothetical protein